MRYVLSLASRRVCTARSDPHVLLPGCTVIPTQGGETRASSVCACAAPGSPGSRCPKLLLLSRGGGFLGAGDGQPVDPVEHGRRAQHLGRHEGHERCGRMAAWEHGLSQGGDTRVTFRSRTALKHRADATCILQALLALERFKEGRQEHAQICRHRVPPREAAYRRTP
jgi:hypothetical protein